MASSRSAELKTAPLLAGARRAEPLVWASAGAVVLALLLLAAVLLLLASNSFRYFWPQPLVYLESDQLGPSGSLGIVLGRDTGRRAQNAQLLLLRGAEEFFQSPIIWLDEDRIRSRQQPKDAFAVERADRGMVFGFIEALTVIGEQRVLSNGSPSQVLNAVQNAREEVSRLSIETREASFYSIRLANGQLVDLPLADVVSVHLPNSMNRVEKLNHFAAGVWRFLSEAPRQTNVQGGVLPAIVGTVTLVLLMAIIVAPLGVLAAVYLSEYAQSGILTRLVRIAVNNLAGVPSIVYGVFGLGFFVYAVGGSIDSVFFADKLPAPTLGTPGLLWAALTMAILTLPVVIVATEEGLARVPKNLREGSLALGATRAETLWRVVLPSAAPAVLTGLILAIARATGEVAPLILVGVAKYAPGLPVSGEFPFVHFDRQFMHLGFYIYDLGFQSPQIDTVEGLVYATALLLVGIVLLLNVAAVVLRGRLREAFAGEEIFR
ncbi:MAG: phosphate ABC transporter permease PstA [Pseudomonadota bacterium]